MAVKKDVREIIDKKTQKRKVKVTWQCEGSFVDASGKSHRYHKRGFLTERDCKQYERELLLNSKSCSGNPEATFKDLFDMFLDHKKKTLKERTYRDLKVKCEKNLLPFWSSFKIKDIKLQHIVKFQNELLDTTYEKHTKVDGKIVVENVKYSNETIEAIQMRLKNVFKYGVSIGMINNLQLLSFKTVKRTFEMKKEMEFWEPCEFNQFLSVVDIIDWIALYNCLFYTGARIGELLALSWNEVNLKDRTITIKKTYNNHHHVLTTPKTIQSYRTVLLPDKCYSSILDLRALHEQCEGFTDDKFLFGFDKPFDDNKIHRYTDKWIKQAGVKKIRIHDFRHSHISLLINMGFDAFQISKRTGNSISVINSNYAHLFSDVQQRMVDKLNSI